MKLYDVGMPAPNPRRVRMFLAEKGVAVPIQRVSLTKGEQKHPEFLALNSLGQVPVLELDDGTTIAESVAICRYFEGLHPQPPLFGTTPLEQALIDMWIRRLDLRLFTAIGNVWIHVHPLTEPYAKAHGITRYRDFGEENRRHSLSTMRWLEREIAARTFIAGESFSTADIVALSILDFARFVGIDIPDECTALRNWHARVSARPSASA